ncbi:type-2 ice-structuring protein-like isoform X1 [Xyrichtys novacula]|uniref:Type-2 ice-structuring protein-like isoform X1 n=1 Tax=Xyrichtys novacula TaxID=13765 RepID=A0AAV1HJM6_XYRNO|nr:type-2 ice-structuring protein-like isoform X1 [Xyrichtys novacula]
MKILAVCALVCAVMALTAAAADAAQEEQEDAEEELTLTTRTWTRIGNRTFLFVPRKLNWADAERNCKTMDGHLGSVHSLWEYNLLRNLIVTDGEKATWLGGSDSEVEGKWRWIDGTPFNFDYWCSGQAVKDNQDCLQINYSARRCWDDVECTRRLPSVCVAN